MHCSGDHIGKFSVAQPLMSATRQELGHVCVTVSIQAYGDALSRQAPALQVLDSLKTKGISIRVASPKLVMEEAPESYKDVSAVVDTCHQAGISKKTCRLRPICVIKG